MQFYESELKLLKALWKYGELSNRELILVLFLVRKKLK